MIDPINLLYERIRQSLVKKVGIHLDPPTRFRASESANCWRQIYYRLDGCKPAPVSPDFEMLGIQGSVDHDIIRQLLHYHNIDIGGITFNDDGTTDETIEDFTTVEVTTPSGKYEVDISFRADGEIDIDGYGVGLLEIKGMGHYPYYHLQKAFEAGGNDGVVERLKTNHIRYYWQMMLTIYLANKFLGKKYKYAYFFPRDRSGAGFGVGKWERKIDKLTGKVEITNTRTGVYVPYDEKIVDHILQRFALVTRRLKEQLPPSQEYSAGSWECKNCPFLYLCHQADERAIKKLEPIIVYPEEKDEDLSVRADSEKA